MIGKRLSHFRILEKIGEGGMGIVYKALDEKLGRHVALKVLQTEAVGDESRRLRFMREARAAAAVTHSHIAAIHAIDEVPSTSSGQAGQIFIAMELVEGRTLDLYFGGRPAAPRDGLRIAIEVAEALSRAHQAGVVHRDLKPQNIIIGNDGHSKVLDFGLAKLLDTAGVEDASAAAAMQTVSAEMTREGKVLGTATHMSPEQARALPVDTRSDIFSFGVLLYQMFTARLPFQGKTVTDTLSAILRDTPPAASQQNAEVPPELERIIDKCLEKEAKDRYQHADDIVVDLRRLRRDTDSVPIPRAESGPVPAATGPVAAAPRRAWRRPAMLLGGVALVAAIVAGVFGLLRTDGLLAPEATGLAVMPFRNLKDVEDPQRMGQILQELIITDLSELQSLTVYSSQRLNDIRKQLGDGAGTDSAIDAETATQVARLAGAGQMLTGSLSQLGSDWILTSQLIDVTDGKVLESERIDGADLYSMVDELSSRLHSVLGVAASATPVSIKDKTTDSMEAYEHYLAGLDQLNDNRYDPAVERFEKAVEIDPRFGQALYKLAIARWWASNDFLSADPDQGARTLEQALEDDVKFSERGRRLARAFLPLLRRDYPGAVPDFEKLVVEYPDEKEAWYGLGEARWHSPGGSEELASIEPFAKALELDPSFHLAYGHMETTYSRLDMHDRAIAEVRGLIEKNPDQASWYEEWIGWLARKGDAIAVEGAIDEAFDRISDPVARSRILTTAGNLIQDPTVKETYYRRALDIPTEEGRARTYVALGWLLQSKGELREAERAFGRAVDIDPTVSNSLFGIFGVLRMEGRFDEAVLKARGLVAQHPEMDLPFMFWIEAAVRKGDEDETARAVERALGNNPDATRKKWVWRNAAAAYLRIGHVTKAEEFGAMARQAASGELGVQLLQMLGKIESRKRNYDVARQYLESEELYDSMPAQFDLLDLEIRQKNFDDAVRIAEQLKQRLPDPAFGIQVWLRPQILAGRYDEVGRLLELELEAIESESVRASILTSVARAHVEAGEFPRAESLVERAETLRSYPSQWDLPLLKARLAMYAGRYDDAAEGLAAITALHPRLTWVLRAVAWNELLRGNAAAAESTLRELIARGPASRQFFQMLALSLAEQGRFRDALVYAEKSLGMLADRESYAVLAWVLVAGELDLERGIAMAEAGREIEVYPWARGLYVAQPSPEHALGLGLLKRRRFDEAAQVLDEAARLRPGGESIRQHLAEARGGG